MAGEKHVWSTTVAHRLLLYDVAPRRDLVFLQLGSALAEAGRGAGEWGVWPCGVRGGGASGLAVGQTKEMGKIFSSLQI